MREAKSSCPCAEEERQPGPLGGYGFYWSISMVGGSSRSSNSSSRGSGKVVIIVVRRRSSRLLI